MGRSGRRVEVTNLADGGIAYWLCKLYLFVLAAVLAAALFAGFVTYLYFARQLPPIPDLAEYARTAPGVTTLYGQDGTVLAELATEWREIVPFDRIPRPLIAAFLSTEDRRFYSHGSIDLRGMARAFFTNLRAGAVLQGGSTITQQVAKSYLSSERSLTRKIKEAIFARRLEARYGKREILSLYLNHIFLGDGAYGVQAAARRYFDRNVWDLDVGQMAMIAGLARAPTRYSPLYDLKAGLARRAVVLDNMAATGALTRAEADRWKRQPLRLHPRRDYFHDVTPYFSEWVRRALVKKYGQKALYENGYRVETTVLPYLDVLAQENVDNAVRKLDKRQGWRGPVARLDLTDAAEFRRRAAALYGNGPLEQDKLYLGLVERVRAEGAMVRVGSRVYSLPLSNMSWAAPFSARDATNDRQITSASAALKKNDVVWVRWAFHSHIPRFSEFNYNAEGEATWLPEESHKPPRTIELELEQTPRVSAALYTFDHENGYVLALAGGDDFDRSEFNRVTQACRQPGSAYKPIFYSLALDRGYSFETEWNDRPKAEVDPTTGELWIPQNIDGSYHKQVTLEKALVWSKNPPSVEIFHILGTKDIAAWARRLGLTTPLITSPKCATQFCSALALGASCVHMDELTRAFAIFARNGRPIQPVYIRRVFDRSGRLLEDHTSYDDPWLDGSAKLDRIAATAGTTPDPVIAPRTAYLTSKLLREIVTTGHSGPIRATRVFSAGKTGTSSRTSDVWFVGYTSRWMTSAWIGDDTYERQLGYKDASFMLSVPMWARYMYVATAGQPLVDIPWQVPPGVKPSDTGGPLKPGFPPPPAAGFDVDGKPIALPDKLQKVIQQEQTRPTGPAELVPQKTVRVRSADPTVAASPHP